MAFYMNLLILSIAFAVVIAKPQYYGKEGYQQQYTTPIPIISQQQEINPDGSYFYSYETANGIKAEEKGYQKNKGQGDNEIQVAQGYFQYPGPDGVYYQVSYNADENGFVPAGAHLPTPPPPPPELEKAYAEAAAREQAEGVTYDDNGNPIPTGRYQQQPQQYQQQQYYQPSPAPSYQQYQQKKY